MKVALTVVVFAVLGVLVWANWPGEALAPGSKADRIVITKRARTLALMQGGRVLKTYSISLGRQPVGAKDREGDRKTPEGLYRIIEHKRKSSFHRALRISYPEERDVRHAAVLGVRPGSDIMIHGLRNGLGLAGRLHRVADWTAGCVAVTNPEIEEIWAAVADGTAVEIIP